MRNFKSGLIATIVAISFAFVALAVQPVTASAAYGKAGVSSSTEHKKVSKKKAKKSKKHKKSKKSKKSKKAKKPSGVFS